MSYSSSDKVEIHDLKLDISENIYFIGSEGSSLQNVILGKINSDFTVNWKTVYPGNPMYSFEMNDYYIYFMLVSSGVQYIVKLDISSGGYANAIKNTDTTQLWTGSGCRVIISNDKSTIYASGYQFINDLIIVEMLFLIIDHFIWDKKISIIISLYKYEINKK